LRAGVWEPGLPLGASWFTKFPPLGPNLKARNYLVGGKVIPNLTSLNWLGQEGFTRIGMALTGIVVERNWKGKEGYSGTFLIGSNFLTSKLFPGRNG